jgi:hypothetical protein
MHPYRSYRPARTEGNPGRGAAVAGLLLAIVACAGCGHEENSSAAAPTLVAMPAAARARCTKAERLRPVCPTRSRTRSGRIEPAGMTPAVSSLGMVSSSNFKPVHSIQGSRSSTALHGSSTLQSGSAGHLRCSPSRGLQLGRFSSETGFYGLTLNARQHSHSAQGGGPASMGNCCWRLLMSAGAESSELT